MAAETNCDDKPINKLCDPNEAQLLWDEYKYRHNLIWQYLIRSTLVVIALITVSYTTKFSQDKLFIQISTVTAIVYTFFTIWVVCKEVKLLNRVKILYRKRQKRYLGLHRKIKNTMEERKLRGNFRIRIAVYILGLLLLASVAAAINFKLVSLGGGITLSDLEETEIDFQTLVDANITASELTRKEMTLEKLKDRLKNRTKSPTVRDEKLTELIKKAVGTDNLLAINNEIKKINFGISEQNKILKQSIENLKPITIPEVTDKCSNLEKFIYKKIKPITFSFGSDEIKCKTHKTLNEWATWIKQNKEYIITIEGHADSFGPNYSNIDLGRRRAEAVKEGLVELGIDQNRVFIVSYGEQYAQIPDGSGIKNVAYRQAIMKITRNREGQCLKSQLKKIH